MNQSKKIMRRRYRPSAYIAQLRGLLNSLLHYMARVLPGGYIVRPFLHRLRGVKIGKNVWIGDDVYLDEDFPWTIEIQDGATIAPRCTLIGHTKGPGRIVVERESAIGTGCVIACGSGQTLTIGEGAVLSAGSTVLNDVPALTLCGPPRIKVYGTVTVPWRKADTLEEFWRGVRPIRAKE